LQLLEVAGLVSSSRRGRERIWTVRTEPLAQASDNLTTLSRRWTPRSTGCGHTSSS